MIPKLNYEARDHADQGRRLPRVALWLSCLAAAVAIIGSILILILMLKAIMWRGAENYAMLLLILIGVPVLLVQSCVLLPIAASMHKYIPRQAQSPFSENASFLSLLSCIVTFVAILLGFAFFYGRG